MGTSAALMIARPFALNSAFERLCDDLVSRRTDNGLRLLAMLLGRSHQEVEQLLGTGILQEAGILLWANSRDYFSCELDRRVVRALLPPTERHAGIEQALLGAALASDLTWQDFDQVARARDFAAAILKSATASRESGINILIYGPPGTGKSAYLRYLAGRLGLEPLFKLGSDLLSKWEGETEAKIAGAFQEARENQRFLIIDEADSFLYHRDANSRSWEVSQVNEILTSMEEHPMPFACSTNLMTRLDPAALRRFTFKVAFRYLTESQCHADFQAFFGLAPPVALTQFDRLTPADFAFVKKILRYLADAPTAASLLDLLQAECALKPDQRRAIGFALPPTSTPHMEAQQSII